MTSANPIPQAVIGCDVGKTSIVVFDSRGGGTRTIPNQPQPLAILAAGLDATYLVVCEATGGYEALLLDALAQAGRPAHRADARRVKAFIRSFGTLGKTDAIDARALARYGQERHASLARWQPSDAERDQLHALVMARRDLVAARTAWSNRAGAPTAGVAAPFLASVVDCLDAQVSAIDAMSAATHNPELRDFYQRLIANGKKPLVALTALMRKLIVICNARLRPAPSGGMA